MAKAYSEPRRAREGDTDELIRLRGWLLSHGDGPYVARTPEEDQAWRRAYRAWLGPVLAGELPGVRVGVIGPPHSLAACAVAVLDHRAPTAHCPGGRVGWVQTVVVDPPARGRGLGRAIMRDALAWLRAEGAETVALQTTSDGTRLYRGLGFEPTGEDLLSLDLRGA